MDVEVAQQGDLGKMMYQLAVDVQYQISHRQLRVWFLRSDWFPQFALTEVFHPGEPDIELRLELFQRFGSRTGVVPGLVRRGRSTEV
nr:hypothetical protein [Rhodococcus qingshengii]